MTLLHSRTTTQTALRRAGVLACLGFMIFWCDDASAKPVFGIDLDSNHIVERERTDTGWGVGVRFGNEWEPLILTLNPELSGQFGHFGGSDAVTTYRAMGGARLGIGFVIEPSVFAHAGVGYLDQDAYDSGFGFAYDGGAALDLTLLPVIDIGIHGQYAGITAPAPEERGASWWTLGLHVEFEGG